MNIDTAFPSIYVKATDLNGQRVTVKIADCKLEEIADGEHKPVVYFQGATKGLVLNKINKNSIVDIMGTTETDEWVGRQIVLYPTRVDFQGRRVDAVRIDPVPGPAKGAKPAFVKPQPVPQPDDDGDAFVAAVQADNSDIPF